MKLVMSLPLNTARGSRSAVPMGRGLGNFAQGSHAVASPWGTWDPLGCLGPPGVLGVPWSAWGPLGCLGPPEVLGAPGMLGVPWGWMDERV